MNIRGLVIVTCASLLALTGCTQETVSSQDDLISRAVFAARECGGPGKEFCNFFNGPIQLQSNPVKLSSRAQDFFPTANRLEFVDSERSRWIAPRNTLTDGASIPAIFVPIIGARRSPEFVNAAAVHDAHCGLGNQALPEFHSRSWEETHRMFYDALRAGGTEETKAKIMFAAVYLGGPRWEDDKRNLSQVPPQRMRHTMREARQYILWTKPTPSRAEIEKWIWRREQVIVRNSLGNETPKPWSIFSGRPVDDEDTVKDNDEYGDHVYDGDHFE